MKLRSWNVNGLRSVQEKGFLKWLEQDDADVICLQEVKCQRDQIDESLHRPLGYEGHWHCAEKKGYSSLVLYTRVEPLSVREGLGFPDIDREGRVQIAEFKNFTLVNAYFPNSQREHARLPYKLEFCQRMQTYLQSKRDLGRNVVICGDFNIAHKDIDLRNPKQNRNNAGFLPEERAWMDGFVDAGFVDTFRMFEPGPDHYTWWSYRPTIRERNIGWRLDYFFCNDEMKDRVKSATHQSNVTGSDHCPVTLDLKD